MLIFYINCVVDCEHINSNRFLNHSVSLDMVKVEKIEIEKVCIICVVTKVRMIKMKVMRDGEKGSGWGVVLLTM